MFYSLVPGIKVNGYRKRLATLLAERHCRSDVPTVAAPALMALREDLQYLFFVNTRSTGLTRFILRRMCAKVGRLCHLLLCRVIQRADVWPAEV